MKRAANVIVGAVAGALLSGACLYGVALLWPRLRGPVTAATAAAVVATSAPPQPTGPPTTVATSTAPSRPRATDESPFLQELIPAGTPTLTTAAVPVLAGATSLPITRSLLQRPYEAQGFDFQPVELGDGRDRWVAASPDRLALVEIIGSDAVEAASVSVFGSLDPNAASAAQRVVYLLTMMNAILPDWSDGAAWFGDEVLKAASQAGDYEAATTHHGVTITLVVRGSLGSITLSFEMEA